MSGGVPPSSRAGTRRKVGSAVARAKALFENFTGHDAEHPFKVTIPDPPKVVAVIGVLDGLLYTTVRDGVTESYIHEFKSKDKPVLCVSPDGRQMLIVGGAYVFTDRGIVDASDRKNLPRHLRGRI